MRFVRHVAAVAWKDLRVELRSREIILTMVFFSVMVVLIFSFAFIRGGKPVGNVAAGILWIAVLFAATLGISRGFEREREGDTMRGLLLAPSPRGAIFLGKAIGVAAFMLITELVVVPTVAFLFESRLIDHPLPLALTLALATIGIAVIGSTFAAMLLRSRSRGVLFPVVLYPILVPLMIGATNATSALLELAPGTTDVAAPNFDGAWFWIKFLLVFDVAFVAISLWFFESLVIE